MLFPISFIAAVGLSASVCATPVADIDECDYEYPAAPAPTSTATSATVSAGTVSSMPAVASSSSSATPAPNTIVSGSSNSTGALQWVGVNESGAEFGSGKIPGVYGTDYTWPLASSIDTLMGKGMNIFRIPFMMERLAQTTMTATLDVAYLGNMSALVSHITAAGGHAVVEPHNFGRYAGSIISSTADFKTFWTNVATEFKSNDKVIFDCNNEFHDMASNQQVADLNQACIDGIRASGATTQYVFVEGTSYTGAWTWTTSGNSEVMGNLTDPSNKIVYEMHQYLDADGSGTSDVCVSSTIGAERIAEATKWLRANGKKGIIGENAGGSNTVCKTAVKGLIDGLIDASNVWMGYLWWGGGPWWGGKQRLDGLLVVGRRTMVGR
ncbi:endo-beta-1,4-glucanase [Diplocarpon rosae]|nr:endo-beta-1,4-glucanase [Diplocarpon rosae]